MLSSQRWKKGFSCVGIPRPYKGAYLAVVRTNGNVSIVVASAPTPWPHENVQGTWKIEEEPN
eukprot:12880301-Prorocentrum_lima.AAC.1